MKKYTDQELLNDYSKWIKKEVKHYNIPPHFINEYLSSESFNSLALGKPEPLAKNKQCDDNFYCYEEDSQNRRCDKICKYCTSDGLNKNYSIATSR